MEASGQLQASAVLILEEESAVKSAEELRRWPSAAHVRK